MIKKINLIFIVLAIFILTSCAQYERLNQNIFSMGTVVNVKIDYKNKNKAETHFSEIKAIFEKYHNLATHDEPSFDGEHNVYYVNETIENSINEEETIEISKELYELIDFALEIESLTTIEGVKYFDISMGKIIDQWKNFLTLDLSVITEAEQKEKLLEVLEAVSKMDLIKDGVHIKEENQKYFITVKKGVKIDLGAIAKGYALEESKKYLKEHEINTYLINAGGSSIYAGINKRKSNQKYLIGLEDPVKSLNYKTGFYAKVNISNQGITTSGNHNQFVKMTGEDKTYIYHHIISPQTKKPEAYYHSITLFENNLALADGLTTAMFNMPKEVLKTFLEDKTYVVYHEDEQIQHNLDEATYEFEWEKGYS